MKPSNSIVLALVLGAFLTGVAFYMAWQYLNTYINLPYWMFFLLYAALVPTVGFYKAFQWGYWIAKLSEEKSK